MRLASASVLLVGACGTDPPPAPPVSGDSGPPAGGSYSSGSDEGDTQASGEDDDGGDGDCGYIEDHTVNGLAPVDVIFVVDNSGSMQEEEASVQASLNDFSQAIDSVDIDLRVILISNYNICVPPPLGSGACPDDDDNPPEFTHIDYTVQSTDALYILTNSVVGPQLNSLTRSSSVKHVVVISDDESARSAEEFDQAFRAMAPKYEGYRFHAIVSSAPPDTAPCFNVSANVGQVYMDLVEMREGILGDLCQQEFAPVLDELATMVMTSTPVACSWPVPDPPDGEALDPLAVELHVEVDGFEEIISRVDDLDACAGGEGWYFTPSLSDPLEVEVCPETCSRLQESANADVAIVFPCAPPPEQAD